jgi:hypothetical protein
MHVDTRPKVKDYRVTVLMAPDGRLAQIHTDDVEDARAWFLQAGPNDHVETEVWDSYLGGYVETDPALGDW